MRHRAIFLDRDGTLNVERSYITTPAQLALLPGVGAAVAQLRAAGFLCVVVTNQSAIARGLMSVEDLDCIHEELRRQLAASGAALDGIYACHAMTEHPERKPAPGMLLRAAQELNIDVAGSWMIGDAQRDIQAGLAAGCRGCVLVRSGMPVEEIERAENVWMADDLLAAAQLILSHHEAASARRIA